MPGVDNAAKLSLEYGTSDSAPILGRMNWLISHDELYAMCNEDNGNFGCGAYKVTVPCKKTRVFGKFPYKMGILS